MVVTGGGLGFDLGRVMTKRPETVSEMVGGVGLNQPIPGVERFGRGEFPPIQNQGFALEPQPTGLPPVGQPPTQQLSTRPDVPLEIQQDMLKKAGTSFREQGAMLNVGMDPSSPISLEAMIEASKKSTNKFLSEVEEAYGLGKQKTQAQSPFPQNQPSGFDPNQRQNQGLIPPSPQGGLSFFQQEQQRQATQQQTKGIDWMALSNVFAHIGAGLEGPGQELGRSMVSLTNRQLVDRRNQGLLNQESLRLAQTQDLATAESRSVIENRAIDNARMARAQDTAELRTAQQDRLNQAETIRKAEQSNLLLPLELEKTQAGITESKSRSDYYSRIRPELAESKAATDIQENKDRQVRQDVIDSDRVAKEEMARKYPTGSFQSVPENEYREARLKALAERLFRHGYSLSDGMSQEDRLFYLDNVVNTGNARSRTTGEHPKWDQFLD